MNYGVAVGTRGVPVVDMGLGEVTGGLVEAGTGSRGVKRAGESQRVRRVGRTIDGAVRPPLFAPHRSVLSNKVIDRPTIKRLVPLLLSSYGLLYSKAILTDILPHSPAILSRVSSNNFV